MRVGSLGSTQGRKGGGRKGGGRKAAATPLRKVRRCWGSLGQVAFKAEARPRATAYQQRARIWFSTLAGKQKRRPTVLGRSACAFERRVLATALTGGVGSGSTVSMGKLMCRSSVELTRK